MQNRARRGIAAVGALVLLVVGLLSARHEAEVAHVRSGSGAVAHGSELAERHEHSDMAHLHGRASHEHDGDACNLLAILHEHTLTSRAPATIVSTRIELAPSVPSGIPAISIAAYRFAPKTSPPALS